MPRILGRGPRTPITMVRDKLMLEYQQTGKIGDVKPENITEAHKIALNAAHRNSRTRAHG